VYRNNSLKAFQERIHHINPGDGPQAVYTLGLAWIPAAVHIGLRELLWRIRHRKKTRELGKNCQGRWFSNRKIGFISLPLIVPMLSWYYFSRR